MRIPLFLVVLIAFSIAGCTATPDLRPPTDQPNVIVIFTDDQGTLDTSAYGSDDLHTPHMDALAERGVRFSQLYAAAPVCSPSRAGLLTGRYPVRAGLAGNAGSSMAPGGMPTTEVTIAEMLQAAGYATAHIGKWHLGYTPETMPNGQGFDYSFGHMTGCIDNYSHFYYWGGPNRHDLWQNGEKIYRDGSFFPDLMVEEAGAFMETHRDEPFFIYFAMNGPHYPYQAEADLLAEYADLPYPRNLYAAFVASMDARIGALMAKVDALGLRENTLVIFQSDHGHSVEERAHGGGGNAGPYRGAKFSLFEGGIRVPAIASMPGTLPEGAVRDQMANGVDWLPTIAAFTGAPLLSDDLDGRSLAPVLNDAEAASPHAQMHWFWATNPDDGFWAVREGPWKLLGNPWDPTGPGRLANRRYLVNLDDDPSEATNLINAHPDVAEHLEGLHRAWFEQAAADASWRMP
ncbi:MAG: sulfatase-like hydrolase/transferase [Bacteroidota bacterium]